MDKVKQNAQVSDPMWGKIDIHAKEHEELQDVLNAVHFGWESDQAQSLKPYYHFRGDITEIDGVLVNGPKVIIPKTLQGDCYPEEDSRSTSRHRKMPDQSKTSDVFGPTSTTTLKTTMRYMSETQVQAGKRANGTA